MLFSPDGTRIASGGWDRTILVWDVFAVPAAPPGELAPLWTELAGDGPAAYGAMRKLFAAGDAAVALIARHLHPAAALDTKRIAALIADLDSDRFAVRQKAFLELATWGDVVETAPAEQPQGIAVRGNQASSRVVVGQDRRADPATASGPSVPWRCWSAWQAPRRGRC